MSVWAIVVAAGRGERFGAPHDDATLPRKQFVELVGTSIVERSARAAQAACEGVVLVLPADVVEGAPGTTVGFGVDAVVAGGATRAESVRAGLAAVPSDTEIVVVHDAARPLASLALFARVIDAVRNGAAAAIPGLPVTDTVKRVTGDQVESTVPREHLVTVQTPQAFRAEVLLAAHRGAPDASDDAALVERAGGRVTVVPGDPRNLKITAPCDLVVADALVRDAEHGAPR